MSQSPDHEGKIPLSHQRAPSFGLGEYWIVTSYLFAVFLIPTAAFVSMIAQMASTNGLGAGSLASSLLILLLAITLLASAWGMQNRIIWGVYFAYVYLASEAILALGLILHGFIAFNPAEPMAYLYIKIGIGFLFLVLPYLWWRYFASRLDLFE